MSQEAVAGEMRDRGFNWRQTTVAKSEAADRPILFSEIVALAGIYRREIEYFLFAGTELDNIIDMAARELESVVAALRETEQHAAALRNDLELHQCAVAVGSAVRRFRNTGERSELLPELLRAFSRWSDTALKPLSDIYESVGIDDRELEEIDREALRHLAAQERERHLKLSEEDLIYESPEILNGVSALLEGGKVDPRLLDALRRDDEYTSRVAESVYRLLVERVEFANQDTLY